MCIRNNCSGPQNGAMSPHSPSPWRRHLPPPPTTGSPFAKRSGPSPLSQACGGSGLLLVGKTGLSEAGTSMVSSAQRPRGVPACPPQSRCRGGGLRSETRGHDLAEKCRCGPAGRGRGQSCGASSSGDVGQRGHRRAWAPQMDRRPARYGPGSPGRLQPGLPAKLSVVNK